MRRSTIIVLGIVTVAAVVGAVIVTAPGPARTARLGTPGAESQPERFLPAIEPAASLIDRIEIENAGQRAELMRTERGWVVSNREGYPAVPDRIAALVSGLASAVVIEPKTAQPELYDRLGVTLPGPGHPTATLVRIHAGEDVVAAAVLGNSGPALSDPTLPPTRYARRVDDKPSYLIATTASPQADPMAWLNRIVLEIGPDRVARARIEPPTGPVIRVARLSPTEPFALEKAESATDAAAVARAGNTLAFISADDIRPAAAIDWTSARAAGFVTFDGLAISAKLVEVDGVTWARFEATVQPDAFTQPEPGEAADAAADDAGPVPPPAETTRANTPLDLDSAPAAPSPAAPATPPQSTPSSESAPIEPLLLTATRDEAERLNQQWEGWAYALPQFKARQLSLARSEYLAK